MTTVPLSVCYGGAKPLGPCGRSNFVPCGWPVGHARGVRGPKSTVPSSAILVGSVAAEQSYRALGTLAPEFPNTSRDFRWQITSFPVHLLIIIHLEIGSLVPPCTHMAGPRSPVLLCYLDKVVGFLMPRSKASFPVPVPHSPFWFLVPRSGSSFLVYRFITVQTDKLTEVIVLNT